MTIRTKIIAAVVLTVTIVLVGFGTLMYYQVIDTQLARLDARLESHGEKLDAELEENKDEPNSLDIPSLLEISTEGLPRPAIRVLDSTGTVMYADSALLSQGIHPWKEVVSRLSIWESITCSGHPCRSYWMPVELDDQYRYSLQVVVSLDDLNSYASVLRFRLIFIIPLLALLSGLAISAIVRSSFKPIAAMIRTAEQTSASDLTRRVTLGMTRDEVHALGAALNTMMGRIDSAFRAQRQFIADASHEIRTPLTIIQSETEFARERVRDVPTKKSLGIVLSEIEHLRKLAGDLLLITK
ncbi:MAG TPA: histidine kinase dimerization/phospho-acceptor domain-containing protein, partial [Bacteroidota bacterium]|nr:histidine kinase dimerization/phospho-acceptor domain-containing protein [Bacteroidota bacterium]